jgi:hypothetical protein
MRVKLHGSPHGIPVEQYVILVAVVVLEVPLTVAEDKILVAAMG